LWPSSKTRVAWSGAAPTPPINKNPGVLAGIAASASVAWIRYLHRIRESRDTTGAHTALESNFDKGKIQDQLDIQTQAVALGTQAMDV
jgi:hypothetical protein